MLGPLGGRHRRPGARQVGAKAWFRFRSFVTTATPVMLAGSFVLGGLYETGAIGPIGDAIAPLVGGLLGVPPGAARPSASRWRPAASWPGSWGSRSGPVPKSSTVRHASEHRAE